ncbi:MAG: ABC transporter ATP-binding protein [Clostridia bacterium]|nr:ABC transporter ATP-binding protein [Clostridia bacterium]
MARRLDELQKQYNSMASDQKRGMMPGRGPGGPGARGRMKGKPKNAKATVLRIMSYLKPYRFRFVLVFFCMFLSTVTSLFGSYMLAPIINRLTLAVKPDADISPSRPEQIADGVIRFFVDPIEALLGSEVLGYVLTAIMILAVIYLVGVLSTYLQARLMLSISLGSVQSIRNDLFCRLQKLSVRYYDSHPTGELMSRFTNDIDNIDVMLNNSLTSLVSGVITLIGTFIFMITTNWVLTLITVVFVPLFIFLGGMIGKRSSRYYGPQQAALGAVNGYMEETVSGQKVIKVFNHEEECVEEFKLLNNDMRDKQFKAQFWGGVMGPIMGNTSQITYAVTVGVGGALMCTRGLTPGALSVFVGYSRQFAMPINMISQQMATLFAALAGAERVFAVIDAPAEGEAGADPIAFGDKDPADFPKESPTSLRGYVKMEHVDFGYLSDRKILSDISLYAKPGQKIAFVGSTGAGKTTVTNLINRFYDIGAGSITIDGYDIRSLDRAFLRKNVAMVLQDTNLFTGTVRENIRYGRPDATDEEVEEAARLASAHSFIMRLEHGYDTVLTGNGANLSQGQRQLLNIARAAISHAPILVLDEATSSVDTRTERHIEHGMERLMANRTTFVIAHRLSTVRNANAIMVLENGVIIERGDHDTLLAMKGRYYELYTGKKELA